MYNGSILNGEKELAMKYIKYLGIAAAMVTLCTGCASSVAEVSSHEVSVIKIIKPSNIPEFSKIVNDFNEVNSDIQVKFVDAPVSTDERHQLYVSALSGSDASVDIYWINDEWTEEFAREEYIIPLDDEISVDNSKYIVDARDMFSGNGSLYALPIGLDMDFIFYRRDLMEQAPADWDGIMAQCRRTDKTVPLGLCLENSDAEDIVCNLFQITKSKGCSYADALSLYKEIISDYESTGDMPADYISAFKTGNAYMLMGKGSLWNKLNSNTSAVKGNVEAAMLPGDDQGGAVSCICGYGLAVNANSKNTAAALKFLDFMDSKEQQQRLSRDCSVMPIIEALYDDAMILDANPYITGIKESVKNASAYRSLNMNGENIKQAEEALIKYFGNEETAGSTGSILEALLPGEERRF